MSLDKLLDKCIVSGDLNRQEIIELLSLTDPDDVKKLLSAGDTVRRANCGDEVQIRALIEFSNICARHCLYCGLRAPNT